MSNCRQYGGKNNTFEHTCNQIVASGTVLQGTLAFILFPFDLLCVRAGLNEHHFCRFDEQQAG